MFENKISVSTLEDIPELPPSVPEGLTNLREWRNAKEREGGSSLDQGSWHYDLWAKPAYHLLLDSPWAKNGFTFLNGGKKKYGLSHDTGMLYKIHMSVSINKYWNEATGVHVVCSCFQVTWAELSSYDIDIMVCLATYIYCLVPYEKKRSVDPCCKSNTTTTCSRTLRMSRGLYSTVSQTCYKGI